MVTVARVVGPRHSDDTGTPALCCAVPCFAAQVAHSPYKGTLDCVQRMLATEGVGAFFKSYRTTIVMNVPFTAIQFPLYETSKKLIMGSVSEMLRMTLWAPWAF